MSGPREAKEVRRAIAAVRRRLAELRDQHRGTLFYWHNGVIRSRRLRPTKGWVSHRVEEYRPPMGQGRRLMGTIELEGAL